MDNHGRILCQWKIPMTPIGSEPATFSFVAQHFNHCATVVPKKRCERCKYKRWFFKSSPNIYIKAVLLDYFHSYVFYESFMSILNDLFFSLISNYIHLLHGKCYEHDKGATPSDYSWRIKDQLDVTCYFISLLMCSTCFGYCASVCNTDTTASQPHRNANTHRTKRNRPMW